jgi:hypothetical protein
MDQRRSRNTPSKLLAMALGVAAAMAVPVNRLVPSSTVVAAAVPAVTAAPARAGLGPTSIRGGALGCAGIIMLVKRNRRLL